ncbi:ABC transporter ATP-binding protein [soil metagenome]
MISFLRRTFKLIDRRARVQFSLFALGSVIVAGLEAVAVALMLPLTDLLISPSGGDMPQAARLVDRFIDVSTRGDAAAVLGVLVMATFTIKGIAAIFLLRWAIGNSLQQEARLARRLFSRYLMAPTAFHLKRNSAEIQRTLNESLVLTFRRTLPFVMGASADLFTLVAIGFVIVVKDPPVAILAILYFLAVGLVYQRFIAGRQKVAAKQVHTEVAERYRQVQEAVRATKEIAVLHREAYFVDRFYETKLQLADAQRILVFYQLLPRYFLDLAFVLGAALMAGYTFGTLGSSEGLATIGLFLTASFRLIAPLNRLMSTFTLARSAGPAVDQVIDDLRVLDGFSELRSGDVSTGRLESSAIELDDVRFRYDESDTAVLSGVSLTIGPGDDVGIVGATGAGNSTLINLLLGLFDPTAGEVTVGGRPLHKCRTDWQLSIGYVPQEILLIDDTIRANIAFGVDSTEIEEAWLESVLRIAQLETFVASLPDGLDTVVGEQGVRLSGGQRQRLGLARAFYHRPTVLVLDEATSALDSETEARIMDTIALLRGSLTVITVSHRLSTLKHCDRIYFLRSGGVAAVGTFEELNAREPEFAQLVALAQLSIGEAPGERPNGDRQEPPDGAPRELPRLREPVVGPPGA